MQIKCFIFLPRLAWYIYDMRLEPMFCDAHCLLLYGIEAIPETTMPFADIAR